jgi:hypothetical protein
MIIKGVAADTGLLRDVPDGDPVQGFFAEELDKGFVYRAFSYIAVCHEDASPSSFFGHIAAFVSNLCTEPDVSVPSAFRQAYHEAVKRKRRLRPYKW